MGGPAGGRAVGLCALIVLLRSVSPAARLPAQVAPNRATAYLHPTDVHDARAVWVNPAGLGTLGEASIYAEVAAQDPGARGRLRQIDAGFNARGLSLGYQRDIFDGGARGHTYRLGIAGASGGLAAGFAVARYGGAGASGTGWDAGVTYGRGAELRIGGVVQNIGQPVVRGLRQRLTMVPGATWHPAPVPSIGLSTHARITRDSIAAYAFGLMWRTATQSRWPIAVLARLDTDGKLRRGAFAIGLSVGGQDQIGVIASSPGDASSIDAASIYAVSIRQATKGRRH